MKFQFTRGINDDWEKMPLISHTKLGTVDKWMEPVMMLWSSFWTTNPFHRWKENVDVNDDQQTMPIREVKKRIIMEIQTTLGSGVAVIPMINHFMLCNRMIHVSSITKLNSFIHIYPYYGTFLVCHWLENIDSLESNWFFNLIEIMYTKQLPSFLYARALHQLNWFDFSI